MTIPSFAKLQRYWSGWDVKLNPLIKDKNGARLFFPSTLLPGALVDGKIVIRPSAPIFIHNAPSKASTTRSKQTKLAIFIAGSFEVSATEEQPCMHKADCNVTFYTCKETDDGYVLDFFDALHFDFELADKQTAFHPIFHVQRGVSRDVNDDTVRDMFHQHLHVEADKVTINNDRKQALGTPYLRLPTPQLDMFSVITLIMADYFCNGGDIEKDAQLVPRFKAILDYLRSEANVVKEGFASQKLWGRVEADDAKYLSAAHWYAECA